MTSAGLRDQLQRELPRLHARGERELVDAFLALDHGAELARLEGYVDGCRALAKRAGERHAPWLAAVARYLAGRALAFPLDRPGDALPDVVALLAELEAGPQRGTLLSTLVELELLRAFHKIDAPGFREPLVAGVRALWPRLRGDLGPCTELLDVGWRTGWWCRDAAQMRATRRLAEALPQALRFSAGYWHARERALEGAPQDAVALLEGLLADRAEMEGAGPAWRHYLEVELARNEVACGTLDAARARLDRVRAQRSPVRDPMLWWDVAIADSALAAASGDVAGEVAAWSNALDAVARLGTERLEAEFALALADAATRAGGRPDAFARAQERWRAVLPTLRSRGDLEAKGRAIAGL